jgi:hypothetical protein
VAALATVSGELLTRLPGKGQATEPERVWEGRVGACRAASQETCHRRASHGAGRGAPEAGDSR